MSKRIYVGNLPFNCDRTKLQKLFAAYGTVETVNVPTGRSQGFVPEAASSVKPRSQGFGFVEFTSPRDAAKAMEALDGHDFDGHRLLVTDRDTR